MNTPTLPLRVEALIHLPYLIEIDVTLHIREVGHLKEVQTRSRV